MDSRRRGIHARARRPATIGAPSEIGRPFFMLVLTAAVVLGLAALTAGADRFVTGASAIARNFGVPPMIIGLTIVGFGTSAPELLVSAQSALADSTGIAIGNVVGSNIANIALVLGVAALLTPIDVKSATLRREFPLLLAVTLMASVLLADGALERFDAVLLLVVFGVLFVLVLRTAAAARDVDPLIEAYTSELPERMNNTRALMWLALGLLGLLLGAKAVVWGASGIARAFGVSDLVIGLTVVAIGTSLPELAAAVASGIKRESDIAIGNVIGSNMFNLLPVLAVAGVIAPGPVDASLLTRDLPIMAGLTVTLLVMAYGFGGPGRITRLEGACLLSAFLAYQLLLYVTATGTLG